MQDKLSIQVSPLWQAFGRVLPPYYKKPTDKHTHTQNKYIEYPLNLPLNFEKFTNSLFKVPGSTNLFPFQSAQYSQFPDEEAVLLVQAVEVGPTQDYLQKIDILFNKHIKSIYHFLSNILKLYCWDQLSQDWLS